jgi:UPF0755 protein
VSGFDFGMADDQVPPEGSTGRRALIVAVAALVALVVVVVVVLAGPVERLFGGGGDYSGSGTGSVLVVVHDGDSARTIGDTLANAGVVKSGSAFADAAAVNSRSRQIGPGTYRLRRDMKASLALALMLKPSTLVDYRVTIPEGYTAAAIIATIAKKTPISAASLQAALADPASLGLPSWAGGHVEGFLFPATYDIQPGETATQALAAMVTRFDQAATQVHLAAGAQRLGLSEYAVVTLASIVQHEGRLVADFPKIAEVFINRLHDDMPIGSDATLLYFLGPSHHGTLTESELALNTPYNTRINKGLPPTAIDSPGDLALNSVLHHAVGPYLYFVTIDKAGHTAYATTLDRFNQLVAESQANGVS